MLIPLGIVFVGSGRQNLGIRNVFPFSPIGMKRFSSYLHWSKEEYICYRLQYATLKPFHAILRNFKLKLQVHKKLKKSGSKESI